MFKNSQKNIKEYGCVFLKPSNSTHRQYEALRAYFVQGLPSKEAAKRFGYTEGSFRILVHEFWQNPYRQFFLPPAIGLHKAPKKDKVRERIITLHKENLSIYDISRILYTQGYKISPVSISIILKEEGFARLLRRQDEERPPGPHLMAATVADVRSLD